MKNITFLGPIGATFSHDAYDILAPIYGAPISNDSDSSIMPASKNKEVLPLIIKHGGYGALAMETLAEGRVAEPVESYIALLQTYESNKDCPIQVIGAKRMKLHFCLMGRRGTNLQNADRIIAHEKGLGACKARIQATNLPTREVSSNGEAARLIAEDESCALSLALGPRSAAHKYNLEILDEAFEDKAAFTTFFLVGPKDHEVNVGRENRVLIVYTVHHWAGALVESLIPWGDEGLNLIQIHSVHVGNRTYHFAIELEFDREQLPQFERAMKKFKMSVNQFLLFGPFAVLS